MAVGYWSKEETSKLISIWSDDAVQAQLEGCRRNSEVYRKIAKELTEAGYTRTMEQCRDKMKKLRAEYKKIKDKRNETGQGRYPEWDYFDAMDDVMGHKPATQPPVIVDSCNYLDDQQSQWSPGMLDNPSTSSLSTTDDGGQSGSGGTEQSVEQRSNQSDRSSPAQVTSKSTKKRKRSKFDVAGDLMDRLLGMQEKSEKMMVEMEEKRVRLEEKQMELDAAMRREEREYHLKLMSMMTRNPVPSPVMPPPIVPSYSMHRYPYSHGFDGQAATLDGTFDPDATQDGL